MAKNIWGDNDAFRDQPVEYSNGGWQESETYTPAPENTLPRKQVRSQPEQEELSVDTVVDNALNGIVDEDSDEDHESIMQDAMLRLAQGELYKMILNHDLFGGVDADPRAARIVQKQIRNFAKESMKVMLGMGHTATLPTSISVKAEIPFNDLEVTILKKLASAASKGATEMVDEANEEIKQAEAPKKRTLNTISSPKSRVAEKPQFVKKAVEPIKRTNRPKVNLPPEMEPDYEPLSKPVEQMTREELEERDRQAAERQINRKAALPANRAPMPDFATQQMLAMEQVSRVTSGRNLSAAISAAVFKNKV